MYRNINNYYFNRPDYGYAYANPYRLNFSRRYPRVVIYDGQQNFNKFTDFIDKNKRTAALASLLLTAGSVPAAHNIAKYAGEHTKVPQTHHLIMPVDSGENFVDSENFDPPLVYPGEYVTFGTESPEYPTYTGKRAVGSKHTYIKLKGTNRVFPFRSGDVGNRDELLRVANHWPGADMSIPISQLGAGGTWVDPRERRVLLEILGHETKR